jgi:hypothetical protein
MLWAFAIGAIGIPVVFVVTTIFRVHYYGVLCEPARR